MSAPLRLAIVGCGEIARWMALFCRLNRRIHLVACCDSQRPVAEAFAARFRLPRAYDNYGALLEAEHLDAVYLAVPHDLHFEMVVAAIEAGIHALVVKPVARTLTEGREIVRRAQAGNVRVGVN